MKYYACYYNDRTYFEKYDFCKKDEVIENIPMPPIMPTKKKASYGRKLIRNKRRKPRYIDAWFKSFSLIYNVNKRTRIVAGRWRNVRQKNEFLWNPVSSKAI